MNTNLQTTIKAAKSLQIDADRMEVLRPLAEYVKQKHILRQPIHLNFICTHNSRRSHLGQVWAQVMASLYDIPKVYCYSGGTEATAIFPTIVHTLELQGIEAMSLSPDPNPVVAFRYSPDFPPIICFSKLYDHALNPSSGFCAIMTCDSTNEACPVVFGAEARIPILYQDPKRYDGTEEQSARYMERSMQIASEMHWVMDHARDSVQ